MQTHRLTWVALASAALMTAGCQSKEPTIIGAAGTERVQILRSAAGNDAAFAVTDIWLINSPNDTTADLTALNVDFDKESVIVLSVGAARQPGLTAEITGVQRDGGDIFVQGVINVPEGSEVSEDVEHPYAAVVVPKVQGTLHPEIDETRGG